MIALDTNVIIDFLVKSQKDHSQVQHWFSKNRKPLATTHTNIAETLRLLTHSKVFPLPLDLDHAIDLMKKWIEGFQVRILEESEDWWMDLKTLLDEIPALRGNEIFDARIALCLRYNGIKEIFTHDSDFSKYSFLKRVPF
ncbi:MAG: PIN domain-containing protein [Chlamydiae bacterium]|nr:PIN domain-containing protein [Chlamydiota bacterium]MBI3266971.1 PIN domain-containing protein [Chlamydiota bacterium]